MDDATAGGLLAFPGAAAALKDTPRHSRTAAGRRESVAEHARRLPLAALAVGPRFPGLDIGRVVALCLVHDLGEAISGDAPAPAPLTALRDEYAAGRTPEAKLAKAPDKIETVDRRNLGSDPPDFDHGFDAA
jgi:putative hydrolase of HD superfamily